MNEQDTLNEKYKIGGYAVLSADEIIDLFKIKTTPENFIYVINALDGLINMTLYLNPEAEIDQWTSKRRYIYERFPDYHDSYRTYVSQRNKRAS